MTGNIHISSVNQRQRREKDLYVHVLINGDRTDSKSRLKNSEPVKVKPQGVNNKSISNKLNSCMICRVKNRKIRASTD